MECPIRCGQSRDGSQVALAGVVLRLGATAILAAGLPSRQASRVDPSTTLRME